NDRLDHYNRYMEALTPLKEKCLIELPFVPEECQHNAHMFYIKCKDFEERQGLIKYLTSNDILPASHYVPLHSSKAGLKYSEFRGEDRYTTKESERLLRLPMYYKLTNEDIDEVVMRVKEFYKFN
ncbi:MAG: DegT/DnrJ/EryC1/StrS family aminotransferase, partial [Butyrivibrio sp.]|nr:DegT/DnrJ/EryC1/StrS family aminotransferase [Butyrivibrio sp.]